MSLIGNKILGRCRKHVFLSSVTREGCFVAMQEISHPLYYTLSCAKLKLDLEQTWSPDGAGANFSGFPAPTEKDKLLTFRILIIFNGAGPQHFFAPAPCWAIRRVFCGTTCHFPFHSSQFTYHSYHFPSSRSHSHSPAPIPPRFLL